MGFQDILLVVISSAGLLHGLTFAVYLYFFKRTKTLTNTLLALILVFMAIRIGKSVVLNFNHEMEPLFIFAGLAFILLIGPLLKWYVMGMVYPSFKLRQHHILELTPFFGLFLASFFVTSNWFGTYSEEVVIVFASALIFIYLHFAFHIFLAARTVYKVRQDFLADTVATKSQKAILQWLSYVIIGFVIIWISYFLNIVEDAVPYIIGPVMYSLVVYFLSYKAFRLKVTDSDGSVFEKNEGYTLFTQLSEQIKENELYLEPDISLASLAKLIGQTPQKTSEIINQYASQNFNDYINHYRVEQAKMLLQQKTCQNQTIASIAFDCGFSSLSSFNSAFKKFEHMTPSSYRKLFLGVNFDNDSLNHTDMG